MPNNCCCVPRCSGRGGHRFPVDLMLKKNWIIAIRRDRWTPQKNSVVCKKHFVDSDYIELNTFGSKPLQQRLKHGATPSVFPWTCPESSVNRERTLRQYRRIEKREVKNTDQQEQIIYDGLVNEVEVQTETPQEIQNLCTVVRVLQPSHASTQTEDTRTNLCVENFVCNDRAIHFYTGLESYKKFLMVLSTLGPAAYHLQYRVRQTEILCVPNQFFLTLIKLRRNMTDFELSLQFGISEFSVSNIFITWINFTFSQWQELNIWPTRDVVNFFMPEDFKKKFPSTRVIVDGVEVPIKKPSSPLAQKATFSSYKNRNTLKTIVGISPGGLVTSIPKAFGGSASDRSLIEIGDLLSKCDSDDSLMADKGFNIQDIFASRNIKVNIPTFLKGRNQFSSFSLLSDRKISSKRVHVERLIGLCKTYKILQSPLSSSQAQLGSQIIFTCFMLCNFRKCIVSRDA